MAEEVGVAFVRLVPSMRGFGPEASRAMNDAAGPAAGDAGRQAGGRFGGAFQLALAGAGVAAGAVLVQGMGEALSQGKITAKLGAQLGTTPEVAQRYGQVAGQLFAGGITENFQQGADAVRATMSAGLLPPEATNAQIKSVATNVADLANTFDLDLGGTATAVGQLIKNGMAPDARSGLDLLAKGLVGTDDRAGDLLETVTEYGSIFKTIGITGPTAMGLVRQGLQAGAKDTDKIADAMKEFSLKATEDSEAVADAFKSLGLNGKQIGADVAAGGTRAERAIGKVLDELREMPATTKRATAIKDLFGGPGEDLGAAIFALDVDKARTSMDGAAGAANDLGEGLRDNAGARLTAFRNGLQQGLVDFLGSKVIPALESFAGWMRDNPNVVKGLAAAIAGVLVPALVLMAVNATRAAVTTVIAWVSSGAAAVSSAATQVAAAGRVVAGWALMAARALMAAGRMAASWLIAMGPVGWVIAAVVALGLLIWANWDKIKKWTAAAWGWVWDKIKKVGKMILDYFLNWTIVGLVIKHWDTIKTKTAAAWNAVVNWIRTVPPKIAAFFYRWSIVGIVLRHWDAIKSGVVNKASALISYVRRLPGRITSALGSLNTLLWSKGQDIVRGLLNGVRSMGGWLRGQLMGFARSMIPGPIAKALGIGSPSKLMADEIGHWIPPGIAMGVEDNLDDVSASSQVAAAAALPRGPGRGTRSAVAPTTNITVSGDGLNRALLEWLRNAVRVDGQGSVQTLLGQPGR